MNKKNKKHKKIGTRDNKFSSKRQTKQAQRIITGIYRGTGKGYAFLTPDGGGEDLFIPGFALSGALNGDRVKAEVFEEGGRYEAHVIEVTQQTTIYVVGTYTVGKSGQAVIISDDGKGCRLYGIASGSCECGKPH